MKSHHIKLQQRYSLVSKYEYKESSIQNRFLNRSWSKLYNNIVEIHVQQCMIYCCYTKQ